MGWDIGRAIHPPSFRAAGVEQGDGSGDTLLLWDSVRDLHPCLRAFLSEISILVYEHGERVGIGGSEGDACAPEREGYM
jgi:hypothetical protein